MTNGLVNLPIMNTDKKQHNETKTNKNDTWIPLSQIHQNIFKIFSSETTKLIQAKLY